ncbi:hypothetical protein AB6806_28195 [Bosea sp. RCC_152_1]|uniref:hypothetical protein n=1 Tax=Bosea sp. RCC_152_1 TaxID=3239228 RepID=UPI003523FAF8
MTVPSLGPILSSVTLGYMLHAGIVTAGSLAGDLAWLVLAATTTIALASLDELS